MICVIGLGYVGLPLAEALSKHFAVIGYDTEVPKVQSLQGVTGFPVTAIAEDLRNSVIDTYIVCVPTPVHEDKTPDLSCLERACLMVGKKLKGGDLVIFESTVAPGCTEEFCQRLLIRHLTDIEATQIHLGYSPERINPGDTEHTIDRVTKIIAANSGEGLERMKEIYGRITTVHEAPSIKAAEAAKIIENVQRDVNIALINEYSMLLHEMGIPTKDVLDAARTKWNWLDFKPGLVGGHCIGVDPYYLTHAAQKLGFHSEMILAGRRVNDGMARYVATEVAKFRPHTMLILGETFKANVGDFRNSKIKELERELIKFDIDPLIIDPYSDSEGDILGALDDDFYCVILYAVDHREFQDLKPQLRKHLAPDGKLFDLTGTIPNADWSL